MHWRNGILFAILIEWVTKGCSERIDNTVLGEPVVECTGSSIRFRIATAKSFQGRLFVHGHAKNPECKVQANGKVTEAGIEIPFDSSCRIDRQRSVSPRGVFVSTTIVVSFHPMFITGSDRAVRVQCFYRATEEHVGTQIGVGDLPWHKHAEPIQMPACRYDILADSPNGPLVSAASVGQRVYHKWTCETPTPEFFCMKVHSCVVEDGHGATVSILNNVGCAIDEVLLQNLNYTENSLIAGQMAHVYKYADYDTLFFQCQISITVRDPSNVNQFQRECPRPVCDGQKELIQSPDVGIRGRTNSERAILRVRNPRESKIKLSELDKIPSEIIDVTAKILATDSFVNETQTTGTTESASLNEICLPATLIFGSIFTFALLSILIIVALIERIKHRRKFYIVN